MANQARCLEKAKKREIIVDKNGVLYYFTRLFDNISHEIFVFAINI